MGTLGAGAVGVMLDAGVIGSALSVGVVGVEDVDKVMDMTSVPSVNLMSRSVDTLFVPAQ